MRKETKNPSNILHTEKRGAGREARRPPATPCHSETMALNFLSAAQVASFPLKETDIALITASVRWA